MRTKSKRNKTHPTPVRLEAIRLSLHCPHGDTVCVAGSFNDWQPVVLERVGDKWHIDLRLAPGIYEYLFLVNKRWLPDPTCAEGRPNPFGGENSVLHVPAIQPPQ